MKVIFAAMILVLLAGCIDEEATPVDFINKAPPPITLFAKSQDEYAVILQDGTGRVKCWYGGAGGFAIANSYRVGAVLKERKTQP